ncbi:RHS repeat protein [Dyella sp. SG609]|uniref:RHS repeat protein n=1 Tax=Dyella sp. SG609 TaxID=2587018 RepID=UPI001447D57D|nr:RHS repeat-associated protein [Dyella sp. SG609]
MNKRFRWVIAGLGLLMAVAQAAAPERTTSRIYDAQGRLTGVDGPRTDVDDVTRFTYDTQGRLARVTDPLGHATSYGAYDMYGHPGRMTDPNGVVSVMTYTPEGWPLTVTLDSTGTPATTTLTYDAIGNVTQSKDADGVNIHYAYDDAGRLTDITDAMGNRIHYTLDAAGNRLKEEIFDSAHTLKRTVSRTYNALSQLMAVTDAFHRTILSYDRTDGYDAAGHPIHRSDTVGVQQKRTYDALHRLVSTIDDYNGTNAATKNTQSVYSYDAGGHLEGVGDPDGLNTLYDYDGFDDLKSVQSPDTGRTSYVHDAAGNVIRRTDAKGVTSTSTYDALNRRTALSYGDSSLDVAYLYDEPDTVTGCAASYPVGRLTRIVERAVTTTYCYDARGNVVRKAQTQGAHTDTVSHTYSLAGRLTGTVTPGGTSIEYDRDATGRISGVRVRPPGVGVANAATRITYLPFGPITGYTLGNGQAVTRSYDANYALTDVVSPALNLHFARDAMGNITALGNREGADPATETYRYDALYRLASVHGPSGTAIEAYTYSRTGDRLGKTGSGLATGAYGYKAGTHWLTSMGSSALSYDANGNVTGYAAGGEIFGFGYNGRNRLIAVQRNGQTVASYAYNAAGQRIAKIASIPQASSQRFAYDESSRLLGEYSSANRDYIWLGDIPVAVVDSVGTASTVSYVHADGLNTPRAVTDTSGSVLWRWDLQGNPFGEKAATSSHGYVFNLRFPGQYADTESGLLHNGFRDYCAACGRYIQSDPIGLDGGLSTYGYVSGNPLIAIDPLGTEQRSPDVLLALVPGQGAWDAAINAWEAGRYGPAAAYAGAMVSEQLLYVASFGQSQAWRTGALCAGKVVARAAATETYVGIGANGRIGEEALKSLGGQSQVYFMTSRGARYIDQFANGVAYEAKVGHLSMSPRVKNQIAKDQELLMKEIILSAEWHFFMSPTTGKVGAARSVIDMLNEAGIGVVMH